MEIKVRARINDKGRAEHLAEWQHFTLDDLLDGHALELDERIDRKTICLFTGKKDIQGTEVYAGDRIEGDLFDKRLPTAGTVLYDDHLCCFVNQNEAGNTPLFKIDKIKVVGHIYEEGE